LQKIFRSLTVAPVIRTIHRRKDSKGRRIAAPSFDHQHRELMEAVDALHEAFRNGEHQTELNRLFQRLVELSHRHFVEEEKAMQATRYPDYAVHRAEHETLYRQLLELQKRIESGEEVFSVEVVYFLRYWVLHHLVDADKKYGRFLDGMRTHIKERPV